jgi:signal peptidase II
MSLFVTVLLVILSDQLSKYVVFKFVENRTTVFSFLRLTHVTNPGVAFGIGKNMDSGPLGKYLFIFLSLGIVIALLVLFGRYCKTRFWARISIGLIVGGAISNLFDRVMFEHVRDFIDFTFWWTFNAADLAICAGVAVLIAQGRKRQKTGVGGPLAPGEGALQAARLASHPAEDSRVPRRRNLPKR